MVPTLIGAGGLGSALRSLSWAGALGEARSEASRTGISVRSASSGRCRGKASAARCCARSARAWTRNGATAYLETDKPQNVAIYERFGFRTVAEDQMLGIPNWFMVRAQQ